MAATTRLPANYVIGTALTEATWHRTTALGTQTQARQHITADPTAYPTLNASGHLDADRWNDDALFEHGLDTILASKPRDTRSTAVGDAVEVRGCRRGDSF